MKRSRDLGIPFEGKTGPFNAITDVPGVEVGHTTLISGEGPLIPGQGPVRTGVTVILPRGKHYDPVFAAWHSLNGCGEMTGTTWVEESGFLESCVAITNTASIGTVHRAVINWATEHLASEMEEIRDVFWFLPVVAETNDMSLNDIGGDHVRPTDVHTALNNARSGPVEEGNVGGGTGMVCHEFKGGIGTSSRQVVISNKTYTVGVLVQANYGTRKQLTIAGVPVGQEITELMPQIHEQAYRQPLPEHDNGSIIAVVATDAPLLPMQLKRIAKRVSLGVGRMGGIGANSSGDIFLAFSTANPGAARTSGLSQAQFLPNACMNSLYSSTIRATEEAITNGLVAARTMTGINGNTVYALPHDRLQEVMKKYNRLVDPETS